MDLSALLGEIERDEQLALSLEERTTGYQARLDRPDEMLDQPQSSEGRGVASPRQPAKEMREEYARKYGLTPERGAVYKTRSGARAGIAAATETGPSRWFLGVQDVQMDCVVLLCQGEGEVLDFVVPMGAMSGAWNHLSRHGRQVKFNVNKRNGTYQLQVPGVGPLNIGLYLGQRGPLV
jgi:hypothetical protein